MPGRACILLWSDEFPRHREFSKSDAQNRVFRASAAAIRQYLLDAGVTAENLCEIRGCAAVESPHGDDAPTAHVATNSHQVLSLSTGFVENFKTRPAEVRPDDLLVYFVGHGLRTPGDSHRLVFGFSEQNSDATTLSTVELFTRLREASWSRGIDLRVIGIIDACYSTLAAHEFERLAAPVLSKPSQAQPTRGLAMLCSAPLNDHSTSRSRTDCTQFTEALLGSLGHLQGYETSSESTVRLSLKDVERRIREHLTANYRAEETVLPHLRTLLEVDGNIADVPLLPAFGEVGGSIWTPPQLPRRWLPRPALSCAVSLTFAVLMIAALPLWNAMRPDPPVSPALPPAPAIDYRNYARALPDVVELSMPPPAQEQLQQINYQVCNRTTGRIRLRFANCTVLARDRLPPEVTNRLTLGKQFDIEIDPGESNDLKSKPFTQKSGSGWYLVFALPAEAASRSDAEWQLLTPQGSENSAVQLFRKQNVNLVVTESPSHAFQLEVQQDDREIDECMSSGSGDAA